MILWGTIFLLGILVLIQTVWIYRLKTRVTKPKQKSELWANETVPFYRQDKVEPIVQRVAKPKYQKMLE